MAQLDARTRAKLRGIQLEVLELRRLLEQRIEQLEEMIPDEKVNLEAIADHVETLDIECGQLVRQLVAATSDLLEEELEYGEQ
jgi:hypothetical protein